MRVFDRRIYVLIGAIALLFLFDFIALWNSLYFYYRWIDIPVHMIAGFLLAMLIFFIVFQNQVTRLVFSRPKIAEQVFTVCVFWVFVIAVLWELFELMIGRTSIRLSTTGDMLLDIVVTTVGAGIFYAIYRFLNRAKQEK